MPRITFSANAVAYQTEATDSRRITSPLELLQFNGFHSDEDVCSDYIDQELVEQLGVRGGRIRMEVSLPDNRLRVTTSYGVERKPTEEEVSRLLTETETQWREGIGNGVFIFLRNEIPSRELLLEIQANEPELLVDSAPFSFDAFPTDEDREVAMDWSQAGGPDDFLIADLQRAVENGDPIAQAELGNHFVLGEMVERDVATGMALLTKSAEQNDEMGVVWLAQNLLEGDGRPLDPERAEQLLQDATEDGSLMAKVFLAVTYLKGKSLPKQQPLAIQMLTEASDEEMPIAMAELGNCYEFGIGVRADLKRALERYEAALEGGFDQVEPAIQRVAGQLKNKGGLFNRVDQMFTSLLGKHIEELDVEDGVIHIEDDDHEMKAAVQKAQVNLNQFIESIRNPKPDIENMVKVKFEDSLGVEFMWLNEVTYAEGNFTGKINNDPMIVKHVEIGETHEAHANDVNDWLIMHQDGRLEGGFTVELLRERQA
ncbi:MAG: TPR repeat protein [Mariniblastus sp.]|jgi:TPR repeat protein